MRHDCSGTVEGPGSTSLSAADLDTRYIEESMIDSIGRAPSNKCIHRSKEVSIDTGLRPIIAPKLDGSGGIVQYSGLDPAWVPSNANWLSGFSNWDVTSQSGEFPNRWSVPSSFALNETSMKNDVLERARGLKADVALNIIESSQMWPSVKSLAMSLPKMAANWGNLRKVIRTASGGYLAWKFGVSPILSDIVSIHKYAGRMSRDLKKHSEGASHRISRSAVVPLAFDTTPSQDGVYNNVVWGERTYLGNVIKTPTVRYVLVTKPRSVEKAVNRLDFFTSRFSSSPASLAWELVPFSFVLDWFVDLRGTLRAVDEAVGGIPYEIVNFTRSFSYELAANVQHTFRNTCNGGTISKSDVGQVRYTHYERIPVSTTATKALWKPRFGKNQAAISAALIGQQLSKSAAANRLVMKAITAVNHKIIESGLITR